MANFHSKIYILLAAALFIFSCGRVKNEKIQVVVLGFDGANWPTIDPLIAAGKLPFLKQLKERSAWADFKTDKPTKSSIIWTSIATGKTMMKHGILDYTYLKDNKIRVPFSNSEKREPSLWQMLDHYGKRSVVINWFVTYPPDRFNGVMVSDHFRHILLKEARFANELIDTIIPTMYFYRLKNIVRRDYRQTIQRIGMPDFPELYQKVHPEGNFKRVFTLHNARTFVMQDALVEDVTDLLIKKEKADLYMSYFRLPDIFQHFALHLFSDSYIKKMFPGEGGDGHMSAANKREVLSRISRKMEPVYRYMDHLLQKYMSDPKFKNAYFIILSDHGFSFYPEGYNHYDLPREMEAPDGILLVSGPSVRPGKTIASIYDIAPTVLYLFGLPVDRKMDGHPLRDLFKLTRKLRYANYFLDKIKNKVHNKSADLEIIEELRELGYIN